MSFLAGGDGGVGMAVGGGGEAVGALEVVVEGVEGGGAVDKIDMERLDYDTKQDLEFGSCPLASHRIDLVHVVAAKSF